MLKDIAAVGDKIELTRYSNQDAAIVKPKSYISQLLDYVETDKACIAMPIESGRIIPLNIKEKYQLTIYTKLGLYQCKVEVVDRYRVENIFMVVVQLISDLEKYQRRQYYRLDCIVDARVCPLMELEVNTKSEQLELSNERYHEAVVIDISGGGCKYNSSKCIEKETKVIIEFSLLLKKGTIHFRIPGRIIYSYMVPNRTTVFEHRVEFLELKEEEREQIVRDIFEEERKRRQKERGME